MKRVRSGALNLLVAVSASVTRGFAGEEGRSVTLEQVQSAAMANSPVVRVAEAEVEEARGRLVAARTYPYNPEIALEGADRNGPGGSSTDRGVTLSQQVEIAGQRGKRVARSEADHAAAGRRLERRRQEVRAAVERAFALALGSRDLMDVAASDLALTRNLMEFQRRRLEAGATSQLELNLAQAAAGRADRRLQGVKAEWMTARTRLAEAAGLDPAKPPLPVGSLPAATAEIMALDPLVATALARRPDLDSLRLEAERARRQLKLERSLAVPDLRLEAFGSREEGDDIAGIGLGLAIPLFNRNQGGIVEASSTLHRTGAETRKAELAVRQEVTEARARLEASTAAVSALSELVVGTLEESLDLLQRSMEAGKVSALDVLLLRRELIEGRREYVEAAVQAWVARVDLELATGGSTLSDEERER